MPDIQGIRQLLRDHYGLDPSQSRLEDLGGAGGFSGARLWRIPTQPPLCLRRWPFGQPAPQRLRMIHEVVMHAGQQGLSFLPVPRRTLQGSSWVEVQEHFWEVTPWLPGQADFHRHPSDIRLQATMTAVARFHRAAAGWRTFPAAVPPGIRQRAELLNRLQSGLNAQLRAAASNERSPPFRQRALRILDHFQQKAGHRHRLLQQACQQATELQPCARDLWHDHILFEGDEVSGIVDFGALNIDSVAADLARLLGSLLGNVGPRWTEALNVYQASRPLTGQELFLIHVYDACNTLLSGINWLIWLWIEQRHFDDPNQILARLDLLLARLDAESG